MLGSRRAKKEGEVHRALPFALQPLQLTIDARLELEQFVFSASIGIWDITSPDPKIIALPIGQMHGKQALPPDLPRLPPIT